MAKITVTYPETGLTLAISVKNRDTGIEAFSGNMSEIGTSKVYTYDFIEVAQTDYIYTITNANYDDFSSVIYQSLVAEIDAELTANHGEGPWNQRVNGIGGLKSNEMEELLDRFKKDILKAKTEPIKEEKETLETKLQRARTEKSQEKIMRQLKELDSKLTSIEENLEDDYTLDYIEDKFNELVEKDERLKDKDITKKDADKILKDILNDSKLEELLEDTLLEKLLDL